MTYIDELRALTNELEALNARTEALQRERGLEPGSGVPFVVIGDSDPEVMQLAKDWEDYKRRDAEFMERHKNHVPGTP